ncbi:hypothetical protein [Phytohabitans rumicis]|uniref:Uncharacterized protein n=1 Tax=Phytohabitans rumicis TaxID=1076125 RepID=A0A6V8L9G9_9ACTN|nr:hypothetical protein [Phytohabitans rumicis]GFJ91451.1 hypothetical protein Prum_050930 [Phytohabitans rumicis]
MLRIVFSSDDIARTRVAPAADPVWETVLSLHLLQGRTREPSLAGWRGDVSEGLRRDVTATTQLRLFSATNPSKGYFPDFLTPSESLHGLQAGMDAIRSTPIERLNRDIAVLAEENALPRRPRRWAAARRRRSASSPSRWSAITRSRSRRTGRGSRRRWMPTGRAVPVRCWTAAPRDC